MYLGLLQGCLVSTGFIDGGDDVFGFCGSFVGHVAFGDVELFSEALDSGKCRLHVVDASGSCHSCDIE